MNIVRRTFRISALLQDIRFWIVVFFMVRLMGIWQAPLEAAHNWRQTTVTMVARNFYENQHNILYPKIDFAGEKTGITGMEFPVFNYLIYLFSTAFGYEHWIGRLINLLFSSAGIYFFYKLVKRKGNEQLAFHAALILLASIWFAYSRKIMPDTFSMSLVLIGGYCGLVYLENKEKQQKKDLILLLIYFVFVGMGVLSKLPSGFILIAFALPFFDSQFNLKRKICFLFVNLFLLVFIGLYYFYWVPYLVKTYHFWHFFMGKSLHEGWIEITSDLNETLRHFYDYALKYSGFLFALIGLVFAVIRKQKKLLLFFGLCLFSFSVIIFKSGFTFVHHAYYIIPFVPVLALLAAFGLSQIPKQNWRIVFLVIIITEGLLNQIHDFRIPKDNAAILNLEKDLNRLSKKTDLIAINSRDYPTPMYFAHRKGWITDNTQLQQSGFIAKTKKLGLKYVVILKKTFGTEIRLNYKIVFENEDYCIYLV